MDHKKLSRSLIILRICSLNSRLKSENLKINTFSYEIERLLSRKSTLEKKLNKIDREKSEECYLAVRIQKEEKKKNASIERMRVLETNIRNEKKLLLAKKFLDL
jgi:hypothetical protein